MYEEIASIETPDDDRVIWRYRPLEPKDRLNTILDGGLYHSRLDQLQDKYEGRYPKGNHDPVLLQMEANQARQKAIKGMREVDFNNHPRHSKQLDAMRERLEKDGIQLPENQLIERYIQNHGDKVAETVRRSRGIAEETARSLYFVNCWHMNNHESDLMWRAYGPERSVVIRSTIRRLKEALSDSDYDVYVGRVKYIDQQRSRHAVDNLFYPTIHKPAEYKHENEVRTIIMKTPSAIPGGDETTPADWDYSAHPTGFPIKVDATKLIDEIRISPGASNQTLQEVHNRCQRYGVNNVTRSVLTDSYK